MTGNVQLVGSPRSQDLGDSPDSCRKDKIYELTSSIRVIEPSPPKLTTRLGRKLHDWWVVEASALFASYIFFAVIVIALVAWDKQATSDWPLSHTLSSMISLIATLMKTAMFVTVTACIGQLKWHHFSRGKAKPVIDMDRIESAGRGATGSVMYLFRFGLFHYASLGAVLMIASLLFNFAVVSMLDDEITWFSQNEISSGALLGVTNLYNESSSVSTNNDKFTATIPMQSAVISGWWFSSSTSTQQTMQVKSTCISGNCTWEDVSTLAIGYSCSTAPVESGSEGIYISTQASINNTAGDGSNATYSLVARPSIPENSSFAEAGNHHVDASVIVHVAALGLTSAGDDYEAAECILYWKVAKISHNSEFNGVIQTPWDGDETYTKPAPNNSSGADAVIKPNWKDDSGCRFGSQSFPRHDPACSFTVTTNAHTGLQTFLVNFLSMSEGYGEDGATRYTTSDSLNAFIYSWNGTLYDTMDGVLQSTTQFMSSEVARSPALFDGEEQDGSVYGYVWTFEAQFTVKWTWAAYPVGMLLVSTALFVITIWQSRKDAIWKNSFLPTLYHSFGSSEGVGTYAYDLRELEGMQEVAANQKARMVADENWIGKRLKLAEGETVKQPLL